MIMMFLIISPSAWSQFNGKGQEYINSKEMQTQFNLDWIHGLLMFLISSSSIWKLCNAAASASSGIGLSSKYLCLWNYINCTFNTLSVWLPTRFLLSRMSEGGGVNEVKRNAITIIFVSLWKYLVQNMKIGFLPSPPQVSQWNIPWDDVRLTQYLPKSFALDCVSD